ncbi:hypothetical protein [Streptomyces sp. NRRL S-146]|uniref:hypothetical protein n=1 Tax=Streptomyces sp. NRRL S-146 TaxID=1463884 RepID=UPI0018FE241B|nr:hypothetical protein [Streptomyces sp. NRRL S-146]
MELCKGELGGREGLVAPEGGRDSDQRTVSHGFGMRVASAVELDDCGEVVEFGLPVEGGPARTLSVGNPGESVLG